LTPREVGQNILSQIESCRHHSGSGSHKVDIASGEEVEVSIWTRSKAGAKWSIKDEGKTTLIDDVEAKHTGGEEPSDKPTQTILTPKRISGPCSLKVSAISNGGRFTSERFLVAFCIY
jgi:hypothetical protein